MENIANIRVPVIAAVEGRAHIHSDYALLANIIEAEGATFQDPLCRGSYAGGRNLYNVELSGWGRSSRGILTQPAAAASAQRIRIGSRCGVGTERHGSGTRSGTGRFVLAGPGSDAPEYAHSFHSTTEGAHRAGSRLRTIARRSVIGRPGKIEAIEEWGCHLDYRESACSPVVALLLHLLTAGLGTTSAWAIDSTATR